MALFSYQQCVFNALSEHKPVVLQAPTGAGKTRASLYPFLYACARPEAIELPGQCIYSVPLRTLANQFVHEYHSTVQDYRQQYHLQTLKRVSLQTGERVHLSLTSMLAQCLVPTSSSMNSTSSQ